MITLLKLSLKTASDWKDANRVRFKATKTQTSLFSAKRTVLHLAPAFRDVSVSISNHLRIFDLDLPFNFNYSRCIESLTKSFSESFHTSHQNRF